jgi:hypothetical protein
LLEGKQIRLYETQSQQSGRTTSMGYTLAHMVAHEDDSWIQGALLAQGLARIRPSARNTDMAAQMMAMEDQAREAKRGLWAQADKYALLNPDNAGQHLNDWAVVEGRVVNVATSNNIVYLNFGPDWRTDFTISIEPDVRKEMDAKGLDPQSLQGKTVRVHGWLESYNGPHIRLNHAVWLEVRDGDEQPSPPAQPQSSQQTQASQSAPSP